MSNATPTKTAQHVQNLFVGDDGISVRGLSVCSYYQPLDATGGDIWQLEPVGKTDALLLFGDVTGHGEAAGMVTGIVAGALEMARLGMGNALQPFMLANLIAHVLLKSVKGEFLVSGLVGRYNPESRVLTLVNAGHPAPRLIRNNEVQALRGDGHPPLGGARTHRYTEQKVSLQKDDLLVFFSDGFSEAPGKNGDELGERALHSICQTYAEGGACVVRNAIQSALREHIEEGEGLDDDLTLLILTVD